MAAKSNSSTPRKQVGSGKKQAQTDVAASSQQKSDAEAKAVDVSTDASGAPVQAKSANRKAAAVNSAVDPSGDTVAWAVASTGTFQLQAPGQTLHPKSGLPMFAQGKELDFRNGPVELDQETLEMVEAVLDGKHTDRTVNGQQWKQIAEGAGLRIIHQGLEMPPIPSWDTTSDDRVVPIAYEAGLLGSLASVNIAERYERQAEKRVPKREPRERVLADLAAVRARYEADAIGSANQGAMLSSVEAGALATGQVGPTVEL